MKNYFEKCKSRVICLVERKGKKEKSLSEARKILEKEHEGGDKINNIYNSRNKMNGNIWYNTSNNQIKKRKKGE